MYVCRDIGGYSHREIATRFQAGSYSTVSSACALLKRSLADDSNLQKQAGRIRRQLIGEYVQQAT